ncbi:MAG: Aminopeptidase [Planctomycetaceae bacterium]|nr:Aminopeptidase [Planctomycetaceae bacterium]
MARMWFLSGFCCLTVICLRAEEPVAPLAKTIPVPSVILAEPLQKHVGYLASEDLQGRGSPESRQLAAKYLVTEFKRLALEPLFGRSYAQEVPGIKEEDGTLPIWGLNVGALLPGADPQLKDEIIVLGVHYDHLGMRNGKIYPGADDNASSVAMMLEVARQLATGAERPKRSIAFVGFDLEEQLLWGSRWFAAHPPWKLSQVKLFITSDMLGRSLGDLPLPVVFVMGSEYGTGLTPLLQELVPPKGLELARLGADLVGTRSDYGPFRDEKVPFLFFSTGEHPDYHTPKDTPDRLNYEQIASISNVILQVVRQSADSTNPPEWIKHPAPDLEEARTIHRITDLLQTADQSGKKPLTQLQRFLVTQTHNKTGQILRKGELTKDERLWLIRSAQALLFTVF